MTNNVVELEARRSNWSAAQVYTMAIVCLLLGLALGYLFRGSRTHSLAASPASQPASGESAQQMPTLDQMKRMADAKAGPLLAQLENDPSNAALLIQLARIYQSTHQFQQAASYYGKAVDINPKDVPTRTELASCLYYTGDADAALSQLRQALAVDPKDANSLFNLGMIRWKGKNDGPGAVQAWTQLLKSNPRLEADKKAQVQQLIAEAKSAPQD